MRIMCAAVAAVACAAALAAGPAAAQSQDESPRIPSWVFERCNRYPTIIVSASGTTIVFLTKDGTAICAVIAKPSQSVSSAAFALQEFVDRLQAVLARFGCWIVTPSYEAIVPGPAGPALVARCDTSGKVQQFLIGYQNGIVIGYRVEW